MGSKNWGNAFTVSPEAASPVQGINDGPINYRPLSFSQAVIIELGFKIINSLD